MFESDGYYSNRALQLRLTTSVHNLLRTAPLFDLHLVESSFVFILHIVGTWILIAIALFLYTSTTGIIHTNDQLDPSFTPTTAPISP